MANTKPANRKPVRWREREATRAVRAAEAAGLNVAAIECCPDGKIIVHTSKNPPEEAGKNEWDKVLDETPLPLRS